MNLALQTICGVALVLGMSGLFVDPQVHSSIHRLRALPDVYLHLVNLLVREDGGVCLPFVTGRQGRQGRQRVIEASLSAYIPGASRRFLEFLDKL
jgi:hypothetical protein